MSGTAAPPAVDAPPLEQSISSYRGASPAMQEQMDYRKRRAKEDRRENNGDSVNTSEQMLSFQAEEEILCDATDLGKSS
jgi:hypothetical protein